MIAAAETARAVIAGYEVELALRRARGGESEPPDSLTWAREHATVVTPEGRRPFVPYSYQATFLSDDSIRRLVLKARQVGMSNSIAIEALHLAITSPDRLILMVSRNGALAQQLVTYCRHTLAGASLDVLPIHESLSELAFANGSRIVSLPAAPGAGRGYPATDAYLDEFAHTAYADLIYDSIVPALAERGRLTVLSTPNGRANLFFRLWQGFEGGEWSRHRVHWSDCPRYDGAWADEQRQRMTRQSWAAEYECDFVASGEAVFDPDDLERCRDGWEGDRGPWERLVTAWDIGRRHDHTVGITLGMRAGVWHVVRFERFLEPFPVVQRRIEARRKSVGGRHYVESNGIGDPVIENLSVTVEPFTTGVKSKIRAIEALKLLVQRGWLKYDSHEHAQLDRELALYQWDDAGLVQDCVIAAAIAAHAVAMEAPARPFASAVAGTRLSEGYVPLR